MKIKPLTATQHVKIVKTHSKKAMQTTFRALGRDYGKRLQIL